MRNRKALRFARKLRTDMTPYEVRLWGRLRGRQLAGWRFRRQADLGPFIADFLCFDPPLVVEVDGLSHDTFDRLRADRARDAYCRWRGFTVLRFSNEDVKTNLEGVVEGIWVAGLALRGERSPGAAVSDAAAPLLISPRCTGGETLITSPPACGGSKRGARGS